MSAVILSIALSLGLIAAAFAVIAREFVARWPQVEQALAFREIDRPMRRAQLRTQRYAA